MIKREINVGIIIYLNLETINKLYILLLFSKSFHSNGNRKVLGSIPSGVEAFLFSQKIRSIISFTHEIIQLGFSGIRQHLKTFYSDISNKQK